MRALSSVLRERDRVRELWYSDAIRDTIQVARDSKRFGAIRPIAFSLMSLELNS